MIYLKNISNFASVLSFECLDCQFQKVSTDTRQYENGDLFVAISGENYNAFEFVESIIKLGCECIVFTQNDDNAKLLETYKHSFPRVKFIAVTDSIEFLQDLSQDHILRLKAINPELSLVSVSGSNGKTTCKEMLKHILSKLGICVVATSKNDNNHLGVPLTLLKLTEETQVGVIELGSNHLGEIKALYHLFIPDHVYVTNIGMTHMEFFPTLEDVFQEEGYPLNHIKTQQVAWVNSDDTFLSTLFNSSAINYKNIGEKAQSFKADNNSLEIWGHIVNNSHLLGKYNYHNLGAMLHIASDILGESRKEALIMAATSYSPELMRSQWLEVKDTKVFLDAYNANPSSMKLALESFLDFIAAQSDSLEKTKVIIGDMLELGENSGVMHCEIGAFLKAREQAHPMQKTQFVFIGEFAAHYQQGYSGEYSKSFASVSEFRASQDKLLENCKYLFLKASRSLQLETILDNI